MQRRKQKSGLDFCFRFQLLCVTDVGEISVNFQFSQISRSVCFKFQHVLKSGGKQRSKKLEFSDSLFFCSLWPLIWKHFHCSYFFCCWHKHVAFTDNTVVQWLAPSPHPLHSDPSATPSARDAKVESDWMNECCVRKQPVCSECTHAEVLS